MTHQNKMKLIDLMLNEAMDKAQDGLSYKLDNSFKLGYLVSYVADLIDDEQISKIFNDVSNLMNG